MVWGHLGNIDADESSNEMGCVNSCYPAARLFRLSLLLPIAVGSLFAASSISSTLERAYELDAGKTVKRDAAAAAKLYAEAATAGDAVANARLGYMYEIGDGVPQDYGQARTHYLAAANAGLDEGHLHLAICYLEGWGGPADRAAFVHEVQIAAEAGNRDAARMMAGIYSTGIGVARDDALAMQWLERAAKAGDAYAADQVGHFAEVQQVRSLMHDETLARSWYQLSAEKDYTDGMRAMARTFLTGPKRDRNWELGHRWLEMAADGGDAEAPYILALYETIGMDAPTRDESKALAWLEMAAKRGNEKATEVLELHKGGKALDAAFKYMLQVPFDDRYVQRSVGPRLAEPTHQPAVYKIVRPVYPFSLRLSGVTGKVMVDFIVDTTGRVQKAFALESSHPLFAERAVRAIDQWRFYPGQKDGRAVNTHMRVPIFFALDDEHLNGVDDLLSHAQSLAEQFGGEVAAEVTDLRLAQAVTKLETPLGSDGQPVRNGRALILLILDPTGTPVHGHVLESAPADLGPRILEIALKARYRPGVLGDGVTVSHELLAYSSMPSDLVDAGLKK